jgi:DNA-binding NtrC family response regulator
MNKEKILICDDEEGVRESLKLILSEKYDIVSVKNGEEATEKLKSLPNIKIALLDIKMPKQNGIDILKEIRATSNIPVIIITGYHSVETACEALRHGASDYIIKPFESKVVLSAIEKVIQ